MNLPTDPFMLMSVVNTKLRDEFPNLEELCSSLDIDKTELIARLESAGFEYMPELNQFR